MYGSFTVKGINRLDERDGRTIERRSKETDGLESNGFLAQVSRVGATVTAKMNNTKTSSNLLAPSVMLRSVCDRMFADDTRRGDGWCCM